MFRSVKLGENSENLGFARSQNLDEVFNTVLRFLYSFYKIFSSPGGLGWWTASLEEIQASSNDRHRTVSERKKKENNSFELSL